MNASAESKSHGTAVASVLVADGYGVAPEISLLTYTNVDKTSVPGNDCMTAGGLDLTSNASLINHAINDGASLIVNTTGSSDHGNGLMPLVMKLEMKLVQDSLTGLVLLGCLRSIQTGPGRVIPRGGKAWQSLQSEDL